ncbi:D-aspartate oxidase-like [Ornithodoros turicata]|uniref:D-aspartate oxidase-like n=1 Tax=Ornithodoros turicata TaxID=34597 RepID=UPI003139B97E
MTAPSRIAVVGAGIVGLSTALCMQENIPNISVTVIADKFIEDTLSYGAGGFIRPDENIGPSYSTTRRWYKESFNYFRQLADNPLTKDAGVKWVSGCCLSSIGAECLRNGIMEDLFPDLRMLSEEELKQYPSKYKFGMFYTSILADPRKYLKWLTNKILQNGGIIVSRSVESFEELAGHYSIIVNCTGLGAKKLTRDVLLTPVRGQTIKVHAPWVAQFCYADGCYVLPGTEYVTLGGIKQLGDWNTKVSDYDRRYIWETCTSVVPSLKNGKVIHDWVGLRPFRQPVRIEAEVIKFGSTTCKVVHNYGHGGHGVNISWATAKDAATLVLNMLKSAATRETSKL